MKRGLWPILLGHVGYRTKENMKKLGRKAAFLHLIALAPAEFLFLSYRRGRGEN